MERLDKVLAPVRRVLNSVACHIGLRKPGLLKLRKDIRASEYNDIHVMWEMLQRTEAEHALGKSKRASFWTYFGWARSSACFGRSL